MTIPVRLEIDTNTSALMSALLSIESRDVRGVFDEEQRRNLTSLVLGMRSAMDEALERNPA